MNSFAVWAQGLTTERDGRQMRKLTGMILLHHYLSPNAAHRFPRASALRALATRSASRVPCLFRPRLGLSVNPIITGSTRSKCVLDITVSRLGLSSTSAGDEDALTGASSSSPTSRHAESKPVLSFPGGGIYFWVST